MRLHPPETKYTNVVEIGKFNMMWNVSIALIPIFLFLLGLHIYFGDVNWTTSLAAAILAGVNVAVLQQTRKYLSVGIWSVLLSVAICQSSIFLVHDSHIVTDIMWCVLTSFFAFFMFGWFVGSFTLLLNLTGLMIFLFMSEEFMVADKGIDPDVVDKRLLINVYYVGAALAFIIYKMMENNNDINKKYSEQIHRNEILMKEIHHRVKNNLQIISSLLRLQSFETDDEQVKAHFDEAIGRIRSMALIHEKMYHNDDMSEIDLPSYLISLSNDILHSHESKTNVDFKVVSEINRVDIKHVVPISLIFNELITNSLKHGFSGIKDPKIRLEIIVSGNQIKFLYSDNGKWKALHSNNSFGLELIETLTEQIEGNYVRTYDEGTHYHFTFSKNQFFFKA